MFEALKKLWNKDPLVAEKPIVVKTNISEPVISFVNAVKKDPKRFTIKKEAGENLGYNLGITYEYNVTDALVNKTFSCKVNERSGYEYEKDCFKIVWVTHKTVRFKSEPWLTDEEVLYVVKELEDFFRGKVERVKSKFEKRARERLTKLYKGE